MRLRSSTLRCHSSSVRRRSSTLRCHSCSVCDVSEGLRSVLGPLRCYSDGHSCLSCTLRGRSEAFTCHSFRLRRRSRPVGLRAGGLGAFRAPPAWGPTRAKSLEARGRMPKSPWAVGPWTHGL